MIETPLYGRFVREDRGLIFEPAALYLLFVRATILVGLSMVGVGFLSTLGLLHPPNYPLWWVAIGLMVAIAGFGAELSLARIYFDLREKSYRRRQGRGFWPNSSSGSFSQLEAIVLIAEVKGAVLGMGVTYHLVLHWRGYAQSSLVLQSDPRKLPGGAALGVGADFLRQRGMRYAKAIGLPFYDNSYFPSPCPTPLLS